MKAQPPTCGRFSLVAAGFWVVLLVLPGGELFAQNSSISPAKSGDESFSKPGTLVSEVADTASAEFVPEYRRAMIIPFDMTYYLSDADHDLAKYNHKTLPQIQQTLRYSLDGNVAASVMDLYSAHRIILDTLPDKNPDLMRLYAAVRYRYSSPWGVNAALSPAGSQPGAQPSGPADAGAENPFSAIGRWVREKTGGEQTLPEDDQPDPYFKEGALLGPLEGRRFMHAELISPEALTYFYENYGTDLFIFVNQLEIRTNYAHCLDRATGTFAREISIHYSIYDRFGKLFAGDVVTVLVSSNTNDLYEVMALAFPPLAAAVVSGLPAPRYVRAGKPGE